MTKLTIGVVPLDNRPCCRTFPQRIGKIAGVEVVQPAESDLGCFTEPGRMENIASWIHAQAEHVAGFVIAADQLAFGGLIASRSPDYTAEQCMAHLSIIPSIKQQYPKLKIYVSSVLMRLGITYRNPEDLKYGKLLVQYSQLYDQVHRLGEIEKKEQLEHVQASIPTAMLQDYRHARQRNHDINRVMIDWAAEGWIDFLAITQEDASATGIHLMEQNRLMEHIYVTKAHHKVMIYPGADEATQTLLIRMIQHFWHRKIKIYPRYSSTAGRLEIADFEDRPVEETVKCHILASGAVCVERPEEADMVVFVNTPMPVVQCKSGFVRGYFNSRHNIWDVIEGIKHELSQGRHVSLADTAIVNAADVELMQYMLEEGLYMKLLSYAGWNTAGNALGTAVAHGIARYLALQSQVRSRDQEETHDAFMMERLMDEWAYQAQVRGEINAWVEQELKGNPNDLENLYDEVNARMQRLMKEKFAYVTSALSEQPSTSQTGCDSVNEHNPAIQPRNYSLAACSLPWNRTFEVKVEIVCK